MEDCLTISRLNELIHHHDKELSALMFPGDWQRMVPKTPSRGLPASSYNKADADETLLRRALDRGRGELLFAVYCFANRPASVFPVEIPCHGPYQKTPRTIMSGLLLGFFGLPRGLPTLANFYASAKRGEDGGIELCSYRVRSQDPFVIVANELDAQLDIGV